MEEVFRFIGVDSTVAQTEGAFEEEHNVSTQKARKNGLAAFLTESALGRTVKNAGKRLVPQRTIEWAKEALSKGVEKPTLSEYIRAQAQDYLREDVEQLRALTGKEFAGWSV